MKERGSKKEGEREREREAEKERERERERGGVVTEEKCNCPILMSEMFIFHSSLNRKKDKIQFQTFYEKL